MYVAPRAGAWIETDKARPLRNDYPVAPRAGAWIETGSVQHDVKVDRSRPVRARGLKQFIGNVICDIGMSRPVRARGLKPFMLRDTKRPEGRAPCGRVD